MPYLDDFRFGIIAAQLEPTGAIGERPSSSVTMNGPPATSPPSGGESSSSTNSQNSVALPVVGAVLGAIVVAALGVALYLFRRMRKTKGGGSTESLGKTTEGVRSVPAVTRNGSEVAWGTGVAAELAPETRGLSELSASR